MVELVDTHGSGSCGRNPVGVRISPTAPNHSKRLRIFKINNIIYIIKGQIAQLVEQRTENPCVGGSIPPLATSNTKVLGDLRKQ